MDFCAAHGIHGALPAFTEKMFRAYSSNEEQQLDALAACGQLALAPGKRERSGPALSIVDEEQVERPRTGTSASVNGVNVYASSPVDETDRETRERLCRNLLRGPLVLGRLKQRPDGL
jgi:hypothetical protein